MSKEFFKVTPMASVFELLKQFGPIGTETLPILETRDRILAQSIASPVNLPGFARSTMDGYAVRAASTFGASESNPAYLAITGGVDMGQRPTEAIGPGQAVRIATGGMLPEGADAVMMIEHTAELDESTLEVYKSVAPGTHVIAANEDISAADGVLSAGCRIRPQEMGLLAAMGYDRVTVFKKPAVGIISTGDELVDIREAPAPGKIRDVNTYSLAGSVAAAGGLPVIYGIIPDDYEQLLEACQRAIEETDMVLVSGGSSVGTRDLTIDVITAMPDSHILVHGIPVRPGKPTILAKIGEKALWGLPGHITSALVVFDRIVVPFIGQISGNALCFSHGYRIPAILTRNLASVQGRTDFVRTKLYEKDGEYYAEPILGPSGLIRTMVQADGLIEIDMHTEGLEKGERVAVIPLR